MEYHPKCSGHLAVLILFTLMVLVPCTQSQFFKDSPTSLMIGPPPMVHDPIRPFCENFTYGNWRVQEFYSPNYPGEYINNTDCVLYLEAPAGFRIKLDFRDKFILEQSEDCKYDYLEVRDGPFAYSPVYGRYCGPKFPPLIRSTGRFLWMQFKTDDLLQYGGFRAVYSYFKDSTQNDGESLIEPAPSICRIPIKLTSEAADGVLDSSDLPSHYLTGFPKRMAVDCTWEIFTESGNQIQLLSTKFELRHRDRCKANNVTVFDGTTLVGDAMGEFCQGGAGEKIDVKSKTNRVFVRVYGASMVSKPNLKLVFSIVKNSVSGVCGDEEFACDGRCIPASLRCNRLVNCKDKSDEKSCSSFQTPKRRHGLKYEEKTKRVDDGGLSGKIKAVGGQCGKREFACDGYCIPARLRCDRVPNCLDQSDEEGCSVHKPPGSIVGGDSGHGRKQKEKEDVEGKAEKSDDSGIPMYIIIAGAVGGAILTCVTIALCVMCRLRKKDRKKREEEARNPQKATAQRNALELAVCNSSNTQMSLSRQNEADGRRQGGPSQYYPGVATTPTTSMKDGSGHRFSVGGNGNLKSNGSTKSMMDDGTVNLFMNDDCYHTDRILNMAQMTSPDDHLLIDSDQHEIYPPPMGMTSIDQRMNDNYGILHVNPWTSEEIGMMPTYSYANSSLKKHQPKPSYLSMTKPYYGSPESKYKKAIKTIENETIKEHQVS